MPRTGRLFEIIQILRSASGSGAGRGSGGEAGSVSKRTIYRDIAALQAMRTPVEGEAGIGYMLRKGYDLPPLNFDEEELEALARWAGDADAHRGWCPAEGGGAG